MPRAGGGLIEKGQEEPLLRDENILYLYVNICQAMNLRFVHFTVYKLNHIDKKILPPK